MAEPTATMLAVVLEMQVLDRYTGARATETTTMKTRVMQITFRPHVSWQKGHTMPPKMYSRLGLLSRPKGWLLHCTQCHQVVEVVTLTHIHQPRCTWIPRVTVFRSKPIGGRTLRARTSHQVATQAMRTASNVGRCARTKQSLQAQAAITKACVVRNVNSVDRPS